MAVNLDKPHLWKQDTKASVDHYNRWFMKFAPKAFRDTRIQVTRKVEKAILDSNDMRDLSPDLLGSRPEMLPTLRMSCCPPLAVDRLVGLAYTSKSLVSSMEEGKLAIRMERQDLALHLASIVKVVRRLLDPDIFVWLPDGRAPATDERHRAFDDCCRPADRGGCKPDYQKRSRETAACPDQGVPDQKRLHEETAPAGGPAYADGARHVLFSLRRCHGNGDPQGERIG